MSSEPTPAFAPPPTPPPAGRTASRWLRLWPFALVLVAGMLMLLPRVGEFGFWDPWEPKYAQSSREMVERGSYIVPYYRDSVRLTKPILVYWGILAGSVVFGLNEFGARIVGICAAIASMLGVLYAVSLLHGRRAGVLAALVLGTMPQFLLLSRQAMPDVYLFTSLGSALLFFALGLFGPERRRNLHFGICYACLALGVLAKGPVLVGVVFLTTLAIYAVIRIDPRRLWTRGMRAESARLALTALPCGALLAAFSAGAFLFGTGSDWWGYSSAKRAKVASFREAVLEHAARWHLANALLVLLGVLALAGAVWMFRREQLAPRRRQIVSGALALTALLAFGVTIAGTLPHRLLYVSLLGGAAAAYGLFASAKRYALRPEIADDLRPYLGPIGRQLLLFAGVFLVVAGPWHIGILIEQGHGYFTDFILKHNVQRAGETINRSGATHFYLKTVVFGYFPWCVFVPLGFAGAVRWWRRDPFRLDGLAAYMMIAAAVIFGIFSYSATKFAHYLAPMLIPMAVIVGLALDRTLQRPHSVASRLFWIVASMLYLSPVIDLLRSEGSEYLISSITMKDHIPAEAEPGTYFKVLLASILVWMLLSIVVRSRLLVGGLMLSALLFGGYINGYFIPRVSAHKSLKNICAAWEARRLPDDALGFYGDIKHGMYFYTENNWDRLRSDARFVRFMDPEKLAFCVVERGKLTRVRRAFDKAYPGSEIYVVDTSHMGYALLASQPVPGAQPLPERGLATTRGE